MNKDYSGVGTIGWEMSRIDMVQNQYWKGKGRGGGKLHHGDQKSFFR